MRSRGFGPVGSARGTVQCVPQLMAEELSRTRWIRPYLLIDELVGTSRATPSGQHWENWYVQGLGGGKRHGGGAASAIAQNLADQHLPAGVVMVDVACSTLT